MIYIKHLFAFHTDFSRIFQPRISCAVFSSPAFSSPAFFLVPHFHVSHFQSPQIGQYKMANDHRCRQPVFFPLRNDIDGCVFPYSRSGGWSTDLCEMQIIHDGVPKRTLKYARTFHKWNRLCMYVRLKIWLQSTTVNSMTHSVQPKPPAVAIVRQNDPPPARNSNTTHGLPECDSVYRIKRRLQIHECDSGCWNSLWIPANRRSARIASSVERRRANPDWWSRRCFWSRGSSLARRTWAKTLPGTERRVIGL